ncbi:MAG: hypothetical protein CVV02_11395 [Firmicutes bacterium HGW-Firmicutes-7]|nr:MAG: hypothetical protein CVV02_11395 [Firmicutes bacterium HGW-Firmicutes-7]
MHYIIFDLEYNQVCPPKTEEIKEKALKCPFEIIQIGAVKVDSSFETISTFNRMVKPTIYHTMNPFVSRLTRITMEQLEKEQLFTEVVSDFIDFIGTEDAILCVWGMSDMKELFRNLHFHEMDTLQVPKSYINLQPYASLFLDLPKGINLSLRNSIDFLNIPFIQPIHDAFNDAYYTTEIFKKIYSQTMQSELYNLNFNQPNHTSRPKKKRTDIKSLIQQFEKMYDREFTLEEQAIIKLAYVMGKTCQFEVEVGQEKLNT